ncbi:MAG: EAL domain-containing protein [Rickettsiaceae bacterium]|nr:MAG: EAL domain-containing protein [Rickettsiaceae bacterium]
MINQKAKLINIQAQLDRISTGYCILIKLINFDEISVTVGSAQLIMNDLNKIVRKSCASYNCEAFNQIDSDKIIVVIPKIKKELLKHLVHNLYTQSQLYINQDIPSAYMNCSISTIDFPSNTNQAAEIYDMLISTIISNKNRSYYCEYDQIIHNPSIIKSSNEQLNQLRKALAEQTHTFAYQPIIDCKTGGIIYYECLLRIPNGNKDQISIGSLISSAEDKGLINIIDRIVFGMVIEELSNVVDINLSVNISNFGVIDGNMLEFAENLLKKYNVASRLIVEITETTLNNDYERTKTFINKLHSFGCKIALDDFGAGFTSLKQLQHLPVDIIKIDGSYIRNITTNYHSRYFVENIIKISEKLGVKTIAEFVENDEIAKFLVDIKIDGMQGNFFAPASSDRKY